MAAAAAIFVPPALRRLPPFPAVATRLMGLLNDPSASFREIADLLRSDAAYSAEILRLANSPLLGLRQEVTSVLQALSIIGSQRLNMVVTTLATAGLLKGCRGLQAAKRCWRHNLACAFAAEAIATREKLAPEEGYMAGLLHDLGRLAFLASDPHVYARLLGQPGLGVVGLCRAERATYGIDHAEAGLWLAHHWGLPDLFQESIAQHHAGDDVPLTPLSRAVREACRRADGAGFAVGAGLQELDVEDEFTVALATKVNAAEVSLAA